MLTLSQKVDECKPPIKARSAALKVTCPNCKAQMLTRAQLVTHYGAKHPKGNVLAAAGVTDRRMPAAAAAAAGPYTRLLFQRN